MRKLGVAIATAGGSGLFPFAPGTVGSLVGVLIYLATRSWPLAMQAALVLAVALVGTWASGVAAAHFGREDPGQVVIDEVAGQLLTLLATGASTAGIVLGFLLFRVFDIVKPWPARQFERFPGGYGIMADDLMAGVYAHLLLRLAQMVPPALF
jgi:phosphatidylglycerophosphatase A